MNENEKKIFYLEMEKKLLKSEKELCTAVEDELKRKYKWIGTIIAVFIAFFGTGSYVLLVKTQLSETRSLLGKELSDAKASLDKESNEAINKLIVAERLQESATKKINSAVDESNKLFFDATNLINDTTKLKNEIDNQLNKVGESIEAAESRLDGFRKSTETLQEKTNETKEEADSLKENLRAIYKKNMDNFANEYITMPQERTLTHTEKIKDKKIKKVINERYREATENFELFGGALELGAEDYLILGNNLFRKRKNKEALKNYDKAIELKPDFAEALVSKGVVLEKMGLYEDALEAYETAIELNHDIVDAWLGKGVVYYYLNSYDEALEANNQAIELNPDIAKGWYNRACIYSIKGKKEKAFSDLKKAIEIDSYNKTMAQTEDDFKNIREDEQFQILTK